MFYRPWEITQQFTTSGAGNGGVGVHLEDGAFAGFLAANITGNLSGLDIECTPQFPITRFIDRTGGITNRVEPAASKSQLVVRVISWGSSIGFA